jgi:fibro-slime domain-containing protein
MSFDKQLTDDMAGTSCVSLFVQEETYGECPSMSDPPVSEGGSTTKKKEGPVNGVGTGGVCDTVFSTDYRTIDVKCSKTISKIVLDFGGDLTQTFTSSKKQASFTGTGAYAGKKLWGGTITASGTAAVYYANPCFPYSCVDTFEFAGTVRDFTPSTNPDFERYVGNDRGIVRSLLPSDKKPRLDTTEADPSISSELHFNNWYRTVSGKNIEIPVSITLSRYADTNNFVYSNNAFFPIDGQGFGNYGSTGHNYHFTYELHGMFTYTGGETFEFIGDDDVWVYINNRLALDLGGVHGAQTAIIDLDSLRSTLGISVGGTYDIDFYYAERHTTESNFKITTSLVIETPVATEGQDKYLLCHVPPGNPGNAHTIVIAKPAILNAHLRNHDGDHLGPCQPTDLSGDGVVDHKDVQTVVDFVRGVSSASVKYVDMGRGDWKLGSSKRSVPVISRATTHDFSRDRSYRAYKKRLEEKKALGAPDLAVVAANDGMLHAFDIETGEEAWAWVPAQVLYYDQPSTWSGRAIESVWYGQTELFDGSPVIEDLWIDDDGDGQKAEDGSEWHRILIVTQGQGGPATLALDITDSGEPRYLWEILPDTDTVATAQSVSRPLITYVMDTTGEEPTRVPVALWGTGDAAPAYSPADNYAQSEANLIIQALDGSAWGPLGSETAGALINVDPVPGINVDLDGDGRAEQAYIAGAITGIDVNGDEALDVIYFPVSTTYEPLDMGDVDGDGKVGTDDISDPGFTWMYKAVINPADPLNPETCVFLDPLDMTGARPEVYYSATTAWLPSGELAVYWGTGGPENRDATSNGYVFGMVDPNPTGCGETAVPISGFGDQGVITLGAGESLTWDPTVYGGVLYFVTYVPDGPTALSGTSRIYGLEYDTGLPAIDENHDGRDVQSYVSVDGPIGSLTISEQGVMFYGLSTASVLSSGSIAVGSLSLTSVDQIQAQPLSWAEIF